MPSSCHFQSVTNQLNIRRLKTFLGCFENISKHWSTNSTYINLKHVRSFRGLLLNLIEQTYQATNQSMIRWFERSLLNINELTLHVSIQNMVVSRVTFKHKLTQLACIEYRHSQFISKSFLNMN